MSNEKDEIIATEQSTASREAVQYDDFHDRTISTKDWFARTFDDVPGQAVSYVKSLFPIATWIYRYNLTWLSGDVRIIPSVNFYITVGLTI